MLFAVRGLDVAVLLRVLGSKDLGMAKRESDGGDWWTGRSKLLYA